MSSLKRFKDDAKEVAAGFECGITLEKLPISRRATFSSLRDNLINGLEDYTYLGVCFFHDDIVQERKDHMWNDPDNDEYESMPLYQCYVYVMK